MNRPQLPVVDLAPWYDGDPLARAEVAAELDDALAGEGAFLAVGHRVPDALRDRARTCARRLFALPDDVLERYAGARRGWSRDAGERFVLGPDQPTGCPEYDATWFAPNRWPTEVTALRSTLGAYGAALRTLADDLLEIAATALAEPIDHFVRATSHPAFTLELSRPGRTSGTPSAAGVHAGTLALTDPDPTSATMPISDDSDTWTRTAVLPGAIVVSVGALLAYGSGHRWHAPVSRAAPLDTKDGAPAPVVLTYSYDADLDATIGPVPPPIGALDDVREVDVASFLRLRRPRTTVHRTG